MFDDVIIFLFFDVIKIQQLRKWKVFEGYAEYLKNGPTDIHQTSVIFRRSSIVSLENDRLKKSHSLLPW